MPIVLVMGQIGSGKSYLTSFLPNSLRLTYLTLVGFLENSEEILKYDNFIISETYAGQACSWAKRAEFINVLRLLSEKYKKHIYIECVRPTPELVAITYEM